MVTPTYAVVLAAVPVDQIAGVRAQVAADDPGGLAAIELEYDEFVAKIRTGGGEMPSISTKEISDDEVKQVFEFLKSL